MIKWAESGEGDFLHALFLAEHEGEADEWLVRVSVLGHVLGERRGRLTWIPRCGPDMGDVAAAEAATEALAHEIARQALPTQPESYVPTEMSLPPADPITHAVLDGLIKEYVEAERALALTADQSRCVCREIMITEPFEPDQASDDDHRSCQRRPPVDDPNETLGCRIREPRADTSGAVGGGDPRADAVT